MLGKIIIWGVIYTPVIDHDKHMCQDCQEMVRGNQESVVAIVACIHDIPGPSTLWQVKINWWYFSSRFGGLNLELQLWIMLSTLYS